MVPAIDAKYGVYVRNADGWSDEKARWNGLATRSLTQSETLCTWRRSLCGTGLIHARTFVLGRLGYAISTRVLIGGKEVPG